MAAGGGQCRCALVIAYLILLYVDELSIESNQISNSPSRKSDFDQKKSCVGNFWKSPFGPDTAKLTLCNIGNYAYAAYVKIGTPGYGVWLEIDTGSADTWILTSDCQSPTCLLRKRFAASKNSKSLRKLDGNFTLTYGRGTRVQGRLVRDRICFADGFCLADRIFGAATKISQNGMYSDGVLGLGFDSLSRFNAKNGKSPSVIGDLSKIDIGSKAESNSQLVSGSKKIFGLRLNRQIFGDGDDNDGGELTLGYVDRAKTNSSSFSIPLVTDNGGYWMIALKQMDFLYSCKQNTSCKNEQVTPLIQAKSMGAKAILDTGSTYILSSSQQLRSELNRWLKNGWVDKFGDHTITDCRRLSSLPDLRFRFFVDNNSTGGHVRQLTLAPEQYTFQSDPADACRRRVGMQFIADVPFTVLGTTFLSNFQTVFDFGEKRVELISLPRAESISGSEAISMRFNFTQNRRSEDMGKREPALGNFLTCAATVFVAVLLTPFR